jgi:hypothetical protein
VANVLFDDWDDVWADALQLPPTACWPGRPWWRAATDCAAWSLTGRSPCSPIRPASGKRTAIFLADEECSAISAILDRLQAAGSA